MAKKENTIPTIIDTPEALTAKIAAMKEAQKIFATFTQEQVMERLFIRCLWMGRKRIL